MPDVEIRERGFDFASTSRVLKDYAPDLRKQLRSEIRDVAKDVMEKQRDKVTKLKSKSSGSSSAYAMRAAHTLSRSRGKITKRKIVGAIKRSGLRDSAARAMKISIRDSGRITGVTIRHSGGAMPYGQKKLGKYMNKGSWRHPVFGNKNAWVTQSVNEPLWFDKPAVMSHPGAKVAIEKAVKKAQDDLAERLK